MQPAVILAPIEDDLTQSWHTPRSQEELDAFITRKLSALEDEAITI